MILSRCALFLSGFAVACSFAGAPGGNATIEDAAPDDPDVVVDASPDADLDAALFSCFTEPEAFRVEGIEYLVTPEGNLNFGDARTRCETVANSRLATVLVGQQDAIAQNIRSAGVGGSLWVGLTQDSDADDIDEGWRWEDDTPVPGDDPGWAMGEPNDMGNEDCGEFVVSLAGFGWNDIECEKTQRALCECVPL